MSAPVVPARMRVGAALCQRSALSFSSGRWSVLASNDDAEMNDDLIDANAEAIEAGREDIDDRMHKELDQQRRDKDAEDMEKYYTEKYVDRDVGGIRNIESGRQRGINTFGMSFDYA